MARHDFARDYRFAEGAKNDEVLPPELRETFQGFVRPGGKTGTRNYIGILTSVNCSASAARFIAREVERSGVLADHPEIDGVVAFVHGTGCGLAAYGEGFDVLRRTQWGYATHANLGGALMVGLGCEVFQIDRMKEEYGLVEGDHFQTMKPLSHSALRMSGTSTLAQESGDTMLSCPKSATASFPYERGVGKVVTVHDLR